MDSCLVNFNETAIQRKNNNKNILHSSTIERVLQYIKLYKQLCLILNRNTLLTTQSSPNNKNKFRSYIRKQQASFPERLN